ncbi:MAG: hypothetical protein DI628_01810 [Blastochloris viridis]|uniref:Uncharacterized protein n=1 Tax=Blastochloris viridis TaxID=1079 RepID=A0A6N4R2U3_BLAVI|nr:MAG: hypothetical protein DI628_01810 [Blastochloris viridis]
MVKGIQRTVPAGEIEEAIDAVGDIIDVFQMNRQVSKDAKDLNLTQQEIDELRDAYSLESSMGAGVHNFRDFNNRFRNDRKLRSSQEILEAAQQRKHMEEKNKPPVNETPAESNLPEIKTSESRDTNPTTIPPGTPQPSILDYLREAVTKAGNGEAKKFW